MPRPTELHRLADVTSDADDPSLLACRGAVVSIGNFDGVHRGHQSLLGDLRALADRLGTAAVAVTFDPHPAAVLRGGHGPTPLTSMATRAERMSDLGIDALIVIRTTEALLSLSATQFYDALVGQRIAAAGMIEGPNFYFGRDRTGNVQTLAQWCQRDGREFLIAAATDDGGRMVSSSRIRDAIGEGDMPRAAEMMGRPHRIVAPVVHGDARGRTLGFPTANLSPINVVIPAPGVYAAVADLGGRRIAAAIHVGPNPTFDQTHNKFEVHLIGFDGDLYDRPLAVDVHHRVRDISRFESADALRQQLTRDVDSVRRIIARERLLPSDSPTEPPR